MTEERKAELREQAAIMLAAAEGKEIEYNFCGQWVTLEAPSFDWYTHDYRVKKAPIVKYIPFTAETFKEHRDRWILRNGIICRIEKYGKHFVDALAVLDWDMFMSECTFDDTGEPCGQKITE